VGAVAFWDGLRGDVMDEHSVFGRVSTLGAQARLSSAELAGGISAGLADHDFVGAHITEDVARAL
jgi:hypothetical protein